MLRGGASKELRGRDVDLLFCKEGHPWKSKVVGVDEHVLDKHVWSTTMLHEGERITLMNISVSLSLSLSHTHTHNIESKI